MTISFKAIRTAGPMIDAGATKAAFRNQMKVYCDELIRKAQAEYDRVPEGPNYIRKYKSSNRSLTSTFHPRGRRRTSQGASGVGVGGGWHSNVSADGTSGEVYNDVPYAKYVQSKDHQSFNNRKAGWRTIEKLAESTSRVFQERMQIAINQGVAKARRERNARGQFV